MTDSTQKVYIYAHPVKSFDGSAWLMACSKPRSSHKGTDGEIYPFAEFHYGRWKPRTRVFEIEANKWILEETCSLEKFL